MRHDGQKCHKRGTTSGKKPRVLFSNFSDQKANRKIQNDSELKTTKPLYCIRKVQNGNCVYDEELTECRRVYGEHRSDRRLLAHPNQKGVSKVPKIQCTRRRWSAALSILVPSFRNIFSTKSVYESNGRGGRKSSSPEHYNNPLSGRPISSSRQCGTASKRSEEGVRSVRNPGLVSKLPKVTSGSIPGDQIFGVHNKFTPSKTVLAKGQGDKSAVDNSQPSRGRRHLSTAVHEYSGSSNLNSTSSRLGNGSRKSSPELATGKLEQKSGRFRKRVINTNLGKVITAVVDGYKKSSVRKTMAVSSNKDYNNRRKFDGLGSPCGRTIPARVMDRPSKGRVIQLQRNEGSSYGPITSIRVSKGASSSGSFRQHNSSSLSEQTRRDKVQKTPRSVTEDLRLGRAESAIVNSSPSERDIKSNGRPSKQTKTVKFRAEAQPGSIQNDNGQMGVARNRPFCQSDELSVQKVFLSRSERSMCNRCVGPRLDLQQSICLSTNPLDSSCITEVETVQNDSDINSTRLAKTIMVPVVTKNAEKRSFTPPSGGITFRSRGTQMGTCSKSASKSVVSERDVLKSKGLSDRVIKTVLNSRKKVTRSIYSKYWKTFLDWKKRNKVKDNKLPTILEFLQDGIERGLALSTIKVQVAAISVFVDKKLALDPLVIRFMKSVERLRPIVKKSCPRWDLSLVLNVLMEEPFEPLEEISLRNLTIKTIFLVAITSAKRVSELEALSSDEQFCSIFEDRVILKTVTDFFTKSIISV
ncbi:uncharacterized protein [Hyperolius riggenbachi]|uniref:uncharacterized protein isoform X1 n=1 Tax=Hyperolius riggenbachi TaxID=752182 RepID=UPI0035A310B2